ncbi:right-handed parallel beta-helix repeat-containing protein [Pendulispora rubella]|uniref:Right-handed parallel beta-helix repeat-containing protein n=1 Tax=Pendulispora rubella TaxID=2741070 RepID=A0ABZ2KS83_9BACT
MRLGLFRSTTLALLAIGVSLPSCSSDDSQAPPADPSCTAATKCTFFSSGTSELEIQNRIATVRSGESVKFGPGHFTFSNQIALPSNVSDIALLGSGRETTVLDFAGLTVASNDSVYAQYVQNLRIEGFAVKDPPGNGIKVLQGTNVTFRDLKTYWSSEDKAKHGGYGLYPVQSTHVLIEKSLVIGASDAGIYVGQSKNIVVQGNEAHGNVAGIELENCFNADVHDNDAHDNAAGILVFDVPHLEQVGGHDIRVFKNVVRQNNETNFAPSALVRHVPGGTGVAVLASTNVEVFQNTFDKNNTAHMSILSFLVVEQTTDPNYAPYQWPSKIHVHDNTFTEGGTAPDISKDLGALLTLGKFPENNRVPDMLYDGILPQGAAGPNPQRICIENNLGSAASAFSNLHLDKFDRSKLNLAEVREMNPPEFVCELPPIAAVRLP